MDLLETIATRRSVRSFTEQKIEKELIEKLLTAAVQAPSATNAQPWAFAVIQDQEQLEEISTKSKNFLLSHVEDFPLLRRYENTLKHERFNLFYNAGTLVIIYAKPLNATPEGDCALAAQNLMLTAHALGLGSCWIGFARDYLNQKSVKESFGVPTEYIAVAPLILGYPRIPQPTIKKKAPEILFWK